MADQSIRWFSLFSVFIALAAPSALAAEGSTGRSQEILEKSPDYLDQLYFNYFGIFHGAPMNDLGSPQTVDRNGVKSKFSSINFDSEITASYLVTPEFGVGPDVPFLLVPVEGQGVILGDVGVKAFKRNTIDYKGFNLYTNLILQAPTSGASQQRGMTLGIKSTPAIRYKVPGSRFTIGSWNEIKEYAGVTTDKTFKLYSLPYVNYKLSEKFSLNVGYEMEWHHNVGDSYGSFTTYQTDFQPGVIWNITPKVMVNPYWQVFTTNRATFDTSAFGAVINATAL